MLGHAGAHVSFVVKQRRHVAYPATTPDRRPLAV
jgi:hypothetical protein